MSEYLSKKAVLESIDAEQIRLMGEHQSVTGYHKRYVTGKYDGLNWVKHQIQSGAFDADESEGTWKATSEFAFRLNDQLEAEVQRLRAALGHIHVIAQSELDDLQYEGQCKTWEEILLTAEEALKGDGNA